MVLAQNERLALGFASLGARNVEPAGNLKIDAPPPPVELTELERLSNALSDRAVFVAASTHEGEEEIVAQAHRELARGIESLCTIIAPRHPERGTAIAERLKEYGIEPHIEGRVKSIYGIYRKVYMMGKSFEELYDVYAVRVIVNTVIECYNILGIIHDLFRPIPNRFKDYISTPKPNMYQSLHMWKNVVRGEDLYIRPFRLGADYWVDSFHAYEAMAYRKILPQLLACPEMEEGPNAAIAAKLCTAIRCFDEMPLSLIPKDSLLREFLVLP